MTKPESNDPKSGVKGQAQGLFDWWMELSSIQPGDGVAKIIQRVLIRIAGIIFMIVFSPILLFALLVAILLAL